MLESAEAITVNDTDGEWPTRTRTVDEETRSFLIALALLAFVSVGAAQALAFHFGMPTPSVASPLFLLSLEMIGFGGAFALAAYVIWLATAARESRPLPRVMQTVRRYASFGYVARRIAPLVLTFLFLSTFNTFKVFIPRMEPFYLDGFLSDADRWIFGTDPWRLTHALIGPFGTRVLDISYGLWFPAWLAAILYFSLFAEHAIQRRFFISFVVIWGFVGIVVATILSSAGPCFLELIHHPYAARYAGLFPLQNAPGAAKAQQYLSNGYRSGDLGLAEGISAMPSVHVAIAALLVAATRRSARIVFWGALLLYTMIFVASVHLGWHYFSDGLLGTLFAMAIWWATKPANPPKLSAGR